MTVIKESQKEEILRALDKPLVIIGMMGAGKTKTGHLLSKALGLPLVDSDDEVERAAGCTISEIFERYGEPAFRDGERRVIRRLLDGEVKIISTGGGAVMTPETAELIWSNAISIWVKADIPVIVERTSRTDKRPLLKNGNPEEILKTMAEKRYPVYSKADITVESHNGPAQAILSQALDKLHAFLCAPRAEDRQVEP